MMNSSIAWLEMNGTAMMSVNYARRECRCGRYCWDMIALDK